MRLITFAINGEARLGTQIDQYIVDLPETYLAWLRTKAASDPVPLEGNAFPTSLLEFLQIGEPAREAANQAITFATDPDNLAALTRVGLAYPAAEVNFLPPILRPGKIIGLGFNYRPHAAEMKRKLPEHPNIFAKFTNTLIGHRQPIVLPTVSKMADYEAELVVVMGQTGKDIKTEDVFDYIAGYTIFNDVTVRDYQHRTGQFLQGKTFDTAGPIGPAFVTADEVSDPHSLDISLRLNGKIMQQGNTADLIFDIPAIISYVSQIMTLEPGDLIATGTPSGVGYARDPQLFLKPGDLIQIEISGLGMLENPVVGP